MNNNIFQYRKHGTEDRFVIRNCIFFAVLSILMCCLFARCRYGFGITFADEFSQPAVIKRFFGGDRLLIDDWQPATTLIGYFLYRCISFFSKFNFTILELRILYVVFQAFVAMIVLLILGWRDLSSRIIAIAYLCSTPYGIMTISYNTVAIGAFLIFSALFFLNIIML
ncbi:MAG: hypothetical protein IJR29_09080 [Butyrivibrio sp.]|nr:hypothetical protein [Butyrivibrio sp.]